MALPVGTSSHFYLLVGGESDPKEIGAKLMDNGNEGVRSVVIVGGGTAGWMAAAMLSKVLGPRLDIRLIESDDISTVGVGEATIPPIISFNKTLGVDEDPFVRATQATFKLGIQFDDWGSLGNSYMHAFGGIGQDLGSSFQHYWRKSLSLGNPSDFWDYSLNCQAARQFKFVRSKAIGGKPLPGGVLTYAYHFDAGLYAEFLRSYSESQGVQRIEGKVVTTALDSTSGFLASVTLACGRNVTADLFIDCSGFRGLLIEQALQTGFEDWSHWLPCDRAIAVAGAPLQNTPPYTLSAAHDAGWRWCIPLQHRTGEGLVYCSQYLNDDAAEERLLASLDRPPLADPQRITFRTGRRRKQWNKNCVALGLASGFIEPLESTSIHLIQTGITRLVAMFPGRAINSCEIDEYNRQSAIEFERIRDFIILHYYANQRTDCPFWTDCREMSVPESLSRRVQLFQAGGKVFREQDELFSKVAWLQVMLGQGIVPEDHHPVAGLTAPDELQQVLANMRGLVQSAVAEMPEHDDVLARIRGG